MAGKQKFVKVEVLSDSKSLAGYKVLGDIAEGGKRTLILERPEQVGSPAPKKAAKPRKGTGSAVAEVHPTSGVQA